MAATYITRKVSDRISVIHEPGVANFLRCNIWHVRGRDFDLVIDTGMGLSPLTDWIRRESDRPLKAIVTHCHYDHSGGLHQFDCRLGHRHEAHILERPTRDNTVFGEDWAGIEIVNPRLHPEFSTETFRVRPAPLTGHLDEGDVIDLGDFAFQVLHLPGHSPGSIGLWNPSDRVLFSGDAIYDGALLDTLYHSNREVYRQTLERIRGLSPDAVHAGHYPSFGRDRMNALIEDYLGGTNDIPEIMQWMREQTASGADIYADHDWSGVVRD